MTDSEIRKIVDDDILNPFRTITIGTSTYEKHLLLKDELGVEIEGPVPKRETLDEFFKRCKIGARYGHLEGHSDERHFIQYKQNFNDYILGRSKDEIIVLEIGFNAGHSADMFLSLDSRIKVVSFDLLLHHYVYYGKVYIDTKYPGRHTLIGGDSKVSVPNYYNITTKLSGGKLIADFIFIDGDHSEQGALADILNMKLFSDENTILLIDNVAPHKGCARGVYLAWKKCIDDHTLIHIMHGEHTFMDLDYSDGWTVCKYNFGAKEFPVPDYPRIIRRMLCSQYAKDAEKCNTLDELNIIRKKMEYLISLNKDYVDKYAILIIDNREQEIKTGKKATNIYKKQQTLNYNKVKNAKFTKVKK